MENTQHPGALLTGLFVGFASVLFTFGYLWPIAPLFPAVVAGIAAVLPFKYHALVAAARSTRRWVWRCSSSPSCRSCLPPRHDRVGALPPHPVELPGVRRDLG